VHFGVPKGKPSGLPMTSLDVLSRLGANSGRGLGGIGGDPENDGNGSGEDDWSGESNGSGGDDGAFSTESFGIVGWGGGTEDGPDTDSNEIPASFIDGECSLSGSEGTVGERLASPGDSLFCPRLRPDTRPMRSV